MREIPYSIQSRSLHTRVTPGSFQLNKSNQPQTTLINEPQCSHRSESVIVTIPHSTHNITGKLFHPNIIKNALPVSNELHCCQSQSKIVTRPLNTMGVNCCTLESMVSCIDLPALKTRQRLGMLIPNLASILS